MNNSIKKTLECVLEYMCYTLKKVILISPRLSKIIRKYRRNENDLDDKIERTSDISKRPKAKRRRSTSDLEVSMTRSKTKSDRLVTYSQISSLGYYLILLVLSLSASGSIFHKI